MKWKARNRRMAQGESEVLQINKKSGSPRLWQRLGIGGICLLLSMGFVFRVYIKAFLWVPVDMHSELKADYSADGLTPRLHTVQLELVRSAIRDQFFTKKSEENTQTDRYATLVSELQTPVATVTPLHPVTQQPTVPPTQTATMLPTTTATGTQTPTCTATATALPSVTSLSTQVYSTAIPRSTKTKSPKPTSTEKPPTQIPPTQPPATQPPPTATQPPKPTKIPPTAPPAPTQPPYPDPTDNPYP